MPRPSPRSIRLAPGRSVIPLKSGSFQAYYRPPNGTTQRRAFPTLDGAQRWLAQMAAQGPLPPLDAAQDADARRALSILPDGYTLEDAARVLARSVSSDKTPTLKDAVSEFLKERSPLVSRLMAAQYRRTLGAFADALPPRTTIGSVTPAAVSDFVDGKTPSVRNAALATISPLFSWAVGRGWARANPVQSVPRAKTPPPPLGILTPAQADALLRACAREEPEAVPYVALGLFAGVRPKESMRLTPSNFRNGYVVLDASVTKTADARTVAMRPNLAKWLAAYPWRGPYTEVVQRWAGRAAKSAGVPWPNDVLRHSFATYAYELTHDAVSVSAEMGHHGTGMFFRHYRALAAPGDGAKFFAIEP